MKDRTVVITGASSGIGKACAKVFAGKGSNVVIAARSSEKLEMLERELGSDAAVLAVKCDVSKEEDCRKLIESTMQRFQSIDVLINNAGLSMRATLETVELSVLHNLMNTNFWGTVYCTKYALPYLLKSKGSVVGISSIAGKKGLPGRTGYSASKFAMEGFLETVRTENLRKGLHVLIACPGFTATEIRTTALSADGSAQGESPRDESKMMTADEVAERIYKAVVGRKRDLILTAEGKLTVLLNKFFPSMMDKIVYNHMAKEPGNPLS